MELIQIAVFACSVFTLADCDIKVVSTLNGGGSSNCLSVCSGTTGRGTTAWTAYKSDSVKVDVDISHCGFKKTPIITSSVEGKRNHWVAKGSSAVYSSTTSTFRQYLGINKAYNPAWVNDKSREWNVNYIAVGHTCNNIVQTCEWFNCGANQECKVVNLFPTCVDVDVPVVCKTGFEVKEGKCQDVDECSGKPCGNGDCLNHPGSYSCKCKKGYEFEKGTCEDINECENNPCSQHEKCANTPGSHSCDCLEGFIRHTGLCSCKPGFEIRDGTCQDIDECKTNNPCKKNEKCTNKIGHHECTCPEGFVKGGDGSCKEIYLSVEIKNRKQLENKNTKKGFAIQCAVKMENIKLDNINDPNNVKWYKNGVLLSEGGQKNIKFNKKKGSYRLFFNKPQTTDSGKYICEFDQGYIKASAEVDVNIEVN